MNPWSTTLTFQDRASKGLPFLMSISKECIIKMSPIWNIHLHSVSIYKSHRVLWSVLPGFPNFQWQFTSEEVSQMHCKLSLTDFNNRHLPLPFIGICHKAHHVHTKHKHIMNLSWFSKLRWFWSRRWSRSFGFVYLLLALGPTNIAAFFPLFTMKMIKISKS